MSGVSKLIGEIRKQAETEIKEKIRTEFEKDKEELTIKATIKLKAELKARQEGKKVSFPDPQDCLGVPNEIYAKGTEEVEKWRKEQKDAAEKKKAKDEENRKKGLAVLKDEPDDKESLTQKSILHSKNRVAILKAFYEKAGRAAVSEVMSDILAKNVEKAKIKYGLEMNSEDYISAVRSIIYGTKQVEVAQEYLLTKMSITAAKKIKEIVEAKIEQLDTLAVTVSAYADVYEDEINGAALRTAERSERMNTRFDTFVNKLDLILKDNKLEKPKLTMTHDFVTEQLDWLLRRGAKGLDFVSKVDTALSFLGIKIKGEYLSEHLREFYAYQSKSIERRIGHMIEKQIWRVRRVQEFLHHVDKLVKKYKQKIKEFIDEWKQKANKYMNEQLDRLKDNARKEFGKRFDAKITKVKLNI